jgi:hypothetical protein
MWTPQLLFPGDAHQASDAAASPNAMIRDLEPGSPRFHGPYYYY